MSMHGNRRADDWSPASGEFELVVSADSQTATFEISALQLAIPDQKQPQRMAAAEQKNATGQPATTQTEANPDWVPAAFRDLGYDLIDPAKSNDDAASAADRRTIMAFQAGERLQVTGILRPEQIRHLENLAATQIEAAAMDAVKTTRQVARTSPVVAFMVLSQEPDDKKKQTASKDELEDQDLPPSGLKSMKGAFYNGKFFGAGELRSGSKFEGEWLDGPTATDTQRPGLGVFTWGNCSATVKTFTMQQGSLDDTAIIEHSIGVVRQNGRKVFTGGLSRAVEELQSCSG